MMVSRRTYLLVSILGAVVPIGVAALATTAPWLLWLWWGVLGAYLGELGWLPPVAMAAGHHGHLAAEASEPAPFVRLVGIPVTVAVLAPFLQRRSRVLMTTLTLTAPAHR